MFWRLRIKPIMQEVFAAGWWAADGKIKYLNP